ncbi:MmgE/PrpD family protein [Hydrogenophaga sp. OTU3427]|uniref:MmgE/PrpD family protein n=1 Tax=Hydrogenophaga sp. OTU3427 TaxID=3043856 RepID=UPI00313DB2FD
MKRDRSGDLAQLVADFVCSDIRSTGNTLDRVKLVFADTVSATVAGATSDVVGPLRSYVLAQPSALPDKLVLGTSIQASAEHAALINGTMAAALEFDDVLSLMPAHPSAVVLAALMATDAALDAPGERVLDAYAVGVEAGARMAQAMTLDHYKRGFHATGTIALFSAVAALARIHHLDPDIFKRSLGLAASMSSGVQGNFGTMTKPLHSGWAARNAVAAVALAQAGLTACESIFEAEGGYFSAYGSPASNVDNMPTPFGKPWVFDEPGVTLKLFPCCYANHRGMDALIHLMKALEVDASEIQKIRCRVPPGGLIPLKFSRPKTHFESLFSMPYALAVTALDQMPGLPSFHQTRVVASDVQTMLERIDVVESSECVAAYPDFNSKSYGSRGEVHVEVDTTDGRTLEKRVRYAPGHPDRPMTWDQAESKFIGCLQSAGFSTQHASGLFPQLRDLEQLPLFRGLVQQLVLNKETT